MTARAIAAVALWLALAGTARGDGDDAAFRAATLQASTDPAGGMTAFEALGAARPITRWTDNAWAEAARLAERAGDFARARRDLAEVLAISDDEQLVRRSRATLARLAAITGQAGEWDAVAAEHERLVTRLATGGDPKPTLALLEALVRDHPAYPRATAVRLTIAQGWERDGDPDRAFVTLDSAVSAAHGADLATARMALARTAIRNRELATADAQLGALAATPGADREAIAEVRAELAVAEHRAWLRWLLGGGLAGLVVLALGSIRRDAGSWRAMARRLARPPTEVLYLGPITVVLVAVAWTGNPLVARAVRELAVAGVAIAWLSGASLDGRPPAARRAIGHAVVAVVAVAAAAYLVLDHRHMLDLIVETWRGGPAPR